MAPTTTPTTRTTKVTTLQNAVLTAMRSEGNRAFRFAEIYPLLDGSGYDKSHVMQSLDHLGRRNLIVYGAGMIWVPERVRPTDRPLYWEH